MSFDACARIVERADPDRFAAAMSVPLGARRVLMPIYAFNAEVVRAPWVTQEEMIAEMRLQWWRDVLEQIAAGGPVRRHEVATPLAEVLTPAAARHLDPLIEARRWDIYRDPFPDQSALQAYLVDTSGRLADAVALSLGRGGLPAAFGLGLGLSRFLMAVPALMDQGRRPLPSMDPDTLRDLCRVGLAGLKQGRAQPECREAFVAAPVLKRIIADPEAIQTGASGLSAPHRSWRLARFSLWGRRFDR